MSKIFIDGHVGSTGLRIHELLAERRDLELVVLTDEDRKKTDARRAAFETADLAILCLPDDAAREAAAWASSSQTRVIDASSVHRVAPGWVYGLPELSGQREQIRGAKLVANPGCYPTSFVLFMQPLIAAGIVPATTPVSVHALSGYSGGGRSLIDRWQSTETGLHQQPFESPYSLDRIHKHIPEMQRYSGLQLPPQFVPAVGPFHNGMRVQIPLHSSVLAGGTPQLVFETLSAAYAREPFVRVVSFDDLVASDPLDEATFSPQRCNGTNRVELYVLPNPARHVVLIGILDNLGKGASGAAVQNLNLMLGTDERSGLDGANGDKGQAGPSQPESGTLYHGD